MKNIESACRDINKDLSRLYDISCAHGLLLNPLKSNVIIFGRKCDRLASKDTIDIQINGNSIPITDVAKNLGVYIDSDLRFGTHVSKTLQKAYYTLKRIYQNRSLLQGNMKKILTNSLVVSQFDYCDSVYGPCLRAIDKIRIQRLQNACVRLIYGIRKYNHVSHKIAELGWLNMSNRRLSHASCLLHRILLDRRPSYLCNKIRFRTDVHHLNLRHRGLIDMQLCYTEMGKRRFLYECVSFYNSLPQSIKQCTLLCFRKHLQS